MQNTENSDLSFKKTIGNGAGNGGGEFTRLGDPPQPPRLRRDRQLCVDNIINKMNHAKCRFMIMHRNILTDLHEYIY
jgi:hypothetical protein